MAFYLGSISSADGSALVRYGDTLIVCGVKMVRQWWIQHFLVFVRTTLDGSLIPRLSASRTPLIDLLESLGTRL